MNDLINVNDLGIAPQTEEQEKAISELTSSGDYLPALRVYGGSSEIVKEGKFPIGHLGLYFSADKILDLGEQTDLLVVYYRPRASIMMGGDQPINFFDPQSANFNAVMEKGKAKVQGYTFGLEYLLWVPSVEQFGCFFMGNPTLRRESDNVKSHVGKAITLKTKLIKGKEHSWHGVEVLSCDTPFDVPPPELIKQTFDEKFANPTDSEVDLANEPGEESRVR